MLRPILRLLASASALAALAGIAAAADLPPPTTVVPAPMYSPTPIAYNWSGFYVGGHGGWGWGEGTFTDGFTIGGQVGVNWQYNNFVLGVEGDGSFVDWGPPSAVGTARLRGGVALDRFMFYGTGGVALQDFNDVGWVAGGGAEYALTDALSRRRRIPALRFWQRWLGCCSGPRELEIQQPVRRLVPVIRNCQKPGASRAFCCKIVSAVAGQGGTYARLPVFAYYPFRLCSLEGVGRRYRRSRDAEPGQIGGVTPAAFRLALKPSRPAVMCDLSAASGRGTRPGAGTEQARKLRAGRRSGAAPFLFSRSSDRLAHGARGRPAPLH